MTPNEFVSEFKYCPICKTKTIINDLPPDLWVIECKAACSRRCLVLTVDDHVHFEPEDDSLVLRYDPTTHKAAVKLISAGPSYKYELLPEMSLAEVKEKIYAYKPLKYKSRLAKFFARPVPREYMTLTEVIKNIINDY